MYELYIATKDTFDITEYNYLFRELLTRVTCMNPNHKIEEFTCFEEDPAKNDQPQNNHKKRKRWELFCRSKQAKHEAKERSNF